MARNGHDWLLFSSHGQVLIYLALFPQATVRQVSDALDLTERHVSRVIQDLEADGMLTVVRGGPGYRNSYAVHREAPLRHPALAQLTLGHLLAAITPEPTEAGAGGTGLVLATERLTP
jgi:hypothetical protein